MNGAECEARVLVTGASGNVGGPLMRRLAAAGVPVRAAVRDPSAVRLRSPAEAVAFDFGDPATFSEALAGVDRVFLLRPPHMAKAEAFAPFVSAMKDSGVKQVVFLSLMGVERNPVVPHHAIEKLLRTSGLGWTFLRPSFYMQNLTTTHRADIVERDEVFVPAGRGATSFIDVEDIAEAAAVVLTSDGHIGRAYTLTGSEALTYAEVADALSVAAGREIRYVAPSGRAFAARMRERGVSGDMITVMRAIYLVARLRMASGVTRDLEELIGRPPKTFAEFARDNASLLAPA